MRTFDQTMKASAQKRREGPVLLRGTGFNSASYVYKGYSAKRKVMGTWLGSVERVKRANKNLYAKEKGKKKKENEEMEEEEE